VAQIEHWTEFGDLLIVLAETPEGTVRTWGKEVSPGVVLSLAEQPGGRRVLTAIEIAPGPDRDMANLSFERRGEAGDVTLCVPADRLKD